MSKLLHLFRPINKKKYRKYFWGFKQLYLSKHSDLYKCSYERFLAITNNFTSKNLNFSPWITLYRLIILNCLQETSCAFEQAAFFLPRVEMLPKVMGPVPCSNVQWNLIPNSKIHLTFLKIHVFKVVSKSLNMYHVGPRRITTTHFVW